MRTIPKGVETVALCLLSALPGILLAFFSRSTLLLFAAPLIQLILVLIYCRFIRPKLEDMLSGTVCEPTQMDCYLCEDESEETGV